MRSWIALLALIALLPLTGAHGAQGEGGAVQRALTLLNVVAEEYREGVADDGSITRALEYDEARAFLAEAEERLASAGVGERFAEPLAALRGAIDAKAAPAQVGAAIEELRSGIMSATGASDLVFPGAPLSPERGRALFLENCVSCHGDAADGRGVSAARLPRPPANFTDVSFMREETPYDFFHIISVGKGASSMPAWDEVLSVQDRWDLVSYLWQVRSAPGTQAESQGIYLMQCAGCHGARGDAQGAYSTLLLRPAASWSDPQRLARRSDSEIFAAISAGVAHTPMPSFAGRLSEQERWNLVAFVRALSFTAGHLGAAPAADNGAARRFAGALRLLATEYRRAFPGHAAPDALEYAESEILLEQLNTRAPSILALLAERAPQEVESTRAQMRALDEAVARRESAARVGTLAEELAAALERQIGGDAPPAPSEDDALAQTRRLLDASFEAYSSGGANAVAMLSDAYFEFEPLERKLAIADAALVRGIEARFLEVRGLMNTKAPLDTVRGSVAELRFDLDRVAGTLAGTLRPERGPYALFVQSALIILREGFEVVLIVGALLAYVTKSGNPRMRRPLLAGAAAGVAASLATAYVLIAILRGRSGSAAEALEGFTMLLAAAVLFWVSYWLVAKSEAERWQRFIQSQVETAVSRGSALALGSTAFLAVYREGVETVLFYRALFGTATAARAAIASGLLAGCAALVIVYTVFCRLGMRIPIRQFFLATSVLLYYLSVVFAGRGVAELQEAGWIGATPLPFLPQIETLGLYPTVQTVSAQALLVLLLVYAVLAVSRARRRARSASVAGDLHQLREMAAAMFRKLTSLPVDPNALETRRHELESALAGVAALESHSVPSAAEPRRR